MSIALLSLLALLAVVVISCFSSINIGFLSLALAFLIGHLGGGLPVKTIVAGFPASLFLTLVGVTLLFTQSHANGTLDKVAARAVALARGNAGLIPIVFFVLAAGLATIGPGNIATAALLAPVAMEIAGRAGIPGFLMAIMLANGANAGGLSPLAPTGIIARDLMARAGMPGTGWANYFNTLAAQSFVAFAGYFLFGGLALLRCPPKEEADASESRRNEPFNHKEWLTLAVVGALVLSVLVWGVDVGMGAFVGAAILSLARAADDEKVIKAMPWGVIVMVTGVTVLVEVLAKTGGLELFTHALARLAGPTYVTGVIAFVTGVISVYSSSSGVVLPTFLPIVPGLVEKLGGGNPLMIAYSINVGAHLVDVSPLSTLGALCLAVAAPCEDRAALFRKLMAWGWSMAVVGAIVCQLFFGYR
jgi:Na+/H+ antiporter NhaD/arsenite permease-like protein